LSNRLLTQVNRRLERVSNRAIWKTATFSKAHAGQR
jgi:hypothetical protein